MDYNDEQPTIGCTCGYRMPVSWMCRCGQSKTFSCGRCSFAVNVDAHSGEMIWKNTSDRDVMLKYENEIWEKCP